MVSEQMHPVYKEPLRPFAVREKAAELAGDANSGNVQILNDLLERMQKRPDRNVGTALELLNVDEPELDALDDESLRLERGYRLEVNLQMLQEVYEMYGVVDSRILVEKEQDELWLTLEHTSGRGFVFKELWGYAAGHSEGDFTPDCFCVTAEAIRNPDSDAMHFR